MSEEGEKELSGLQYLSQTRPEAMQHLLAFFKESGRHLDPKTRFLISVVTKVINFSPRGLRQYMPRALKEGASRDELIDAILCAYPAAGLTKVVDAIEVLRELDREGKLGAVAAPPSVPAAPQWMPVLRAEEVLEGEAKVVGVGEKQLAVFNVGGEFLATANTCLHQGGYLGDGFLDGEVVICPRHGWQFNVRSGACLTRSGKAVRTYEVRVREGQVEVLV
ncbi:MAG: Rieske 2Fe-2S domain-containing protein [Candidatus Latescibacteria bacterium]|nr:Rieske 2Fe-2S domain-containing protein [Candidatus Latescibacterota bacterium]